MNKMHHIMNPKLITNIQIKIVFMKEIWNGENKYKIV